jgi:hypothetical protein
MIVFNIGAKVKVLATGQPGEVIGHDGYGSVENMIRLNPKPYILNVDGKMMRFDAEELEALSQ